MLKVLRLLLLPFSLVFGVAVILRNFLYDKGVLKSCAFDMPVIVVGNLEVGGSGKSPVIEYLIRLLKDRCRVAVLSRGYGRKTNGFICTGQPDAADREAGHAGIPADEVSAALIGDEPFQYFSKFGDVTVAVDADRVAAIRRLREYHDLILLDDAYQHRRLVPGFSILVFDYNALFRPRLLLPAGNYREPFYGRKRADVLLVSKAPLSLNPEEKERVIARLQPVEGQPVYFSSVIYEEIQALDPAVAVPAIGIETHVVLLTGIARPEPLVARVKEITPHVTHLKYPDHHSFTVKNIAKIAEVFEGIDSPAKVILTTEKDAARLRSGDLKHMVQPLPVFYWPVRVRVHEPGRVQFEERILEYAGRQTGHAGRETILED